MSHICILFAELLVWCIRINLAQVLCCCCSPGSGVCKMTNQNRRVFGRGDLWETGAKTEHFRQREYSAAVLDRMKKCCFFLSFQQVVVVVTQMKKQWTSKRKDYVSFKENLLNARNTKIQTEKSCGTSVVCTIYILTYLHFILLYKKGAKQSDDVTSLSFCGTK